MDVQTAQLDVAIVGCGAAGINAALVLARARRHIAVFDDSNLRNVVVPRTYGFPVLGRAGQTIPPSERMTAGTSERKKASNTRFEGGAAIRDVPLTVKRNSLRVQNIRSNASNSSVGSPPTLSRTPPRPTGWLELLVRKSMRNA